MKRLGFFQSVNGCFRLIQGSVVCLSWWMFLSYLSYTCNAHSEMFVSCQFILRRDNVYRLCCPRVSLWRPSLEKVISKLDHFFLKHLVLCLAQRSCSIHNKSIHGMKKKVDCVVKVTQTPWSSRPPGEIPGEQHYHSEAELPLLLSGNRIYFYHVIVQNRPTFCNNPTPTVFKLCDTNKESIVSWEVSEEGWRPST